MKYKIEISKLTDYYIVAVKEVETSKLKETFTLNESGVDMLKMFYQKKDVNLIAEEISSIYEVPSNVVIQDVQKFSDYLNKKGLL